MKIVLDDIRSARMALGNLAESYMADECRKNPDEWVLVLTSQDVIPLIESGKVTEITFDNDLGIASKQEGWQVLEYMCQLILDGKIKRPVWIGLHTGNIVAMQKMWSLVENMDKMLKERVAQA